MQKLSGFLLIVGTFIFGWGEQRVDRSGFGDPQQMVQSITGDPGGWRVTMAVWGAGSVIVALGLWFFIRQVRDPSSQRRVHIAGPIAVGLAAAGALAWVVLCYLRIAGEPEAVVRDWLVTPNGVSTIVLSMLFSTLTQIAILLCGLMLMWSGYPKWLAWFVLVLDGLLMIVWLALGGGPPVGVELPLLVLGIGLLFMRSPSPAAPAQPAFPRDQFEV